MKLEKVIIDGKEYYREIKDEEFVEIPENVEEENGSEEEPQSDKKEK